MILSKKSRAELKAYFIKNAIPTQNHFYDLIDATLSHKDDGITKSSGGPLCLETASTGERPIIQMYETFTAETPNFVMSLLPGVGSGDTATGKGLGIGNGSGADNAQLFIEESTGNVGIGTVDPGGQKLKVGGTMTVKGLITAKAGISVDALQTFTANGTTALKSGATVSGGALLAQAGATITGGGLTVGASGAAQPLDVYGTLTAKADAAVTGTLTAGYLNLTAPPGDPAPVITARTIPTDQGASNEATELIIFHGNDNGNGSGPDLITLRAPGLRLQTYNSSAISTIDNASGSNTRLYIDPTGKTTIYGSLAASAGAAVTGGALTVGASGAAQSLTVYGSISGSAGGSITGGSFTVGASGATQPLAVYGSITGYAGATITGGSLTVGASGATQPLAVYGSITGYAGGTITGGSLTVGASGAAQPLNVYGAITGYAGGTITGGSLTVGASGAAQALNVYGAITGYAGGTITGGSLTVGASGAAQPLTVYGAITGYSGGSITGGTVNIGASGSGQILNVYGALNGYSGASLTGGTVNVGASGAGQILNVYGALNANAGATVTGGALNVGSSTTGQILNAYGALNANAGATVTGGALNVGSSTTGQVLNAYGALYGYAGATITGAGLTVGTAMAPQTVSSYGMIYGYAGGTITGGALTVGTSTVAQALNVYGGINGYAGGSITGGTVNIGTSSVGQILNVYGALNANAGATVAGGALNVGSSTTGQQLNVYGALNANAGATVAGGALNVGSSTTGQQLNVYGALNANAGGTITGGALNVGNSTTGQNLNVYGSLNANAGLTVTGGALTVGSSTTGQTLTVYGQTTVNSSLVVSSMTTIGGILKCTTSELQLDNTTNRGTRTSGYRRAMYHTSGDILMVNYAGDYTGGIKLKGQTLLAGDLWAEGNNVYLGGVGDHNHGVGYFGSNRPFAGSSIDGPVLYGYAGGALGTIHSSSGVLEGALVLNGGAASAGGYVTISNGMTDDFSGGLTISAWVYFSSLSYSYARIVDFGNGSGNNNILMCQVGTTTTLRLHVYNGTNSVTVDAASVLSTGTWMHLAATVDASGTVKMYKNGVSLSFTTNGTMSLPSNVTRSLCYIGRSNWSTDGSFGGKLAHVKLWTRALSSDELGDDMNDNRNVSQTSLAAWWPLDEGGTGTSARDLSGNGRTGTLSATGATWETYQYAALKWDSSNNVTVNNKLTTGNAKSTVTATSAQTLSTANTWTDLDSMSLTVTTGSNANLLILFDVGAVQNNVASTGGYFQILVDGTAVTQSVDQWNATGWQMHTVSLHYLKTGLSSGSHTIKVQWYTTGGSLLICQTGLGAHRTLTAVEI